MASNDDNMYWLESDIQKIQVKSNMYIHEYGKEGAFHLLREVAQNGFDEVTNPKSPGKNVDISYDKSTDIITVEDDGRGFPEGDFPLDIFCTKLQSGSKFFHEDGGSSGEFGVEPKVDQRPYMATYMSNLSNCGELLNVY